MNFLYFVYDHILYIDRGVLSFVFFRLQVLKLNFAKILK